MICSILLVLYQGSRICTCLIFLKSKPSDPAFEISTTFIFSPLILSLSVIALISLTLSGEYALSPVIIIYLPMLVFGLSFNRLFLVPYLVNPISSRAKATGTNPPSRY